MTNNRHLLSLLQALLVTFLWSTSFVIIKRGLVSIPPITFAGLRYFIASVCLLPFLLRKKYRDELRSLQKGQWLMLISLGLVFYVLTQGAQFIGLSLLPSATVSLILNFTPVVVVIFGSIFLREIPTMRQAAGTALFIAGAFIFFLPFSAIGSQIVGLSVMVIGVIANATSSVLGRKINKKKNLTPYTITLVSMAFGSSILLSVGVAFEGIPRIPSSGWYSILWLSAVNTAFAFTLWNHTLRHLSAMESSIINGTMLVQIAILARIFLGEQLTVLKIVGMVIASVGAVIVQLKSVSKESQSQ